MGGFAREKDGPGRVRRWAPRLRRARGGLALGSVLAVLAGSLGLVTLTSEAQGAPVPAGFTESVVLSGLTNPTVVRFSPDGRVFVAEKRGVSRCSTR